MSVPMPVPVSRLAEAANESAATREAKQSFGDLAAREWVFAVVGPAGSGTSSVAEKLKSLASTAFETEDVFILKASDVIKDSLDEAERARISQLKKLEVAKALQDAGDDLRKSEIAAVALKLMSNIKSTREGADKRLAAPEATVIALDGQKEQIRQSEKPTRVYILDSLKNPAEAEFLRGIYRESFCLIGVVCEESARKSRLLSGKCSSSSPDEIKLFMQRDESADIKHGQKVADTFHLSDYFVDNTPERHKDPEREIENPNWDVPERLGRLFDILTSKKIVRPEAAEIGMFHAKGAQLRSACLSRQVGAALTDSSGNIIATGTNEVPAAGGGVYGSGFDDGNPNQEDHRCHVHHGYCSNTKIQDKIIDDVINSIDALKDSKAEEREKIASQLKKTPLGRLIEFSRAVHAEMDALLSAARMGFSTLGTRLFVTTFPCHYCARHIVASGVEEVQYIEPYPKSRAFELHSDAIQKTKVDWTSPGKFKILLQSGRLEADKAQPVPKVLFRAFTGVAPRLYRRAFLKDGPLKDASGKMVTHVPDWERGLLRASYMDVEKHLEALGQEKNHA